MKAHSIGANKLAEEAVNACLCAWRSLRQGGDINPSEEYNLFLNRLLKKIDDKEITKDAGMIPLLLCIIVGISTDEELTDLEAVRRSAKKSLKFIESARLNEDEKSALRSIIYEIIDRNFPSCTFVASTLKEYDRENLRPFILRYVDGYNGIILGRDYG